MVRKKRKKEGRKNRVCFLPHPGNSAVHVGITWKARIGKIKEIFSNGVVNLSRTLSWTRTTVEQQCPAEG